MKVYRLVAPQIKKHALNNLDAGGGSVSDYDVILEMIRIAEERGESIAFYRDDPDKVVNISMDDMKLAAENNWEVRPPASQDMHRTWALQTLKGTQTILQEPPMPTNKTTVTITELCEKHWPEGCAHFERHRGVVVATGERLEVFSFYLDPADKDDDGCDLLICCESKRRVAAAVAVQHFRNVYRKYDTLIKNGTQYEEVTYAHLRNQAEENAAAWETLANDL